MYIGLQGVAHKSILSRTTSNGLLGEGGGKGLDVFKISVLSTFSPEFSTKMFIPRLCLLYVLLVRKNFDSSKISCPFSFSMVMESTSLTTSKALRPI